MSTRKVTFDVSDVGNIFDDPFDDNKDTDLKEDQEDKEDEDNTPSEKDEVEPKETGLDKDEVEPEEDDEDSEDEEEEGEEEDAEDAEDSDDSDKDEDVEEDESEDGEEEDIDDEKVRMIYDILNEYVGLPQVDKVDANKLEELLEELPANLMIQYLSDKPSYVQDLFLYLDSKENPSVEDVKNFFDTYVSGEEKVLRTYDDPDEAREFLMDMPEMKKLYKSEEKRRAAIDALDDDEVLERANEIVEEKRQHFEEERKKAIEEEKRRKQEQKKKEREFWNTVNQVVEQLDWAEARKKKIKETWRPDIISEKWQTIIQNPEHFVQFVNVLTYYNDQEGFKELYELIDKKAATPKNQKKKESLKSKSLRDYLRSSTKKKRRSSKTSIEDFLE